MNFRGIFPRKAVLPAVVLAVATSTPVYAAADNLDAGIAFVIFFLILAIVYELPAIIAFVRGHPNRWLILVLCTTLSGTGIVWLGCLVWSFKAIHITNDPGGTNGGESGLNLLANDVQRIRIENPAALLQPPSAPSSPQDAVEKLERLKKLLDDGAIDRAQFERLRDLIAGG
ncbi:MULTISPECIES: superinfection immunity protein [unclassified Mesorhizobium]|uniref:superinfection immunity protein n=1 Tax=unclassified Mesorhizobium TaxID=325217 RepID=UPI001125D182|nr:MULTISPECIES: superinfection immunity protein [unclassified Mesorhizobium]TPL72302.1 superinfection immunity protein [Mesorhizobium sp. B2-3-15]TPM02111.1 superinfection immunity protein [Mesorhizobium sp. B2-3-10]